MKKIILSVAIIAIAFTANAQDSKKADAKEFKFSVGVEGGLPLGDLKVGNSFGIGGSLQGEYAVDETVGITLNAGFLTFTGKTIDGEKEPSLSDIPVLAGAKFYFAEKFYGHAQVGMSFFSQKFAGESISSSAFTYAPTIGVMPSENIDIALKYQASTKNGFTTSFIGLRVAYVF